jgi:pyruvate/2-oxoglutarate dehydrogenase complex dihydrolipoamide dehydrogenase (E3) component
MLASTATAEARTAVSALYGIKYAKTFSGTLAIFSTVVDNRVFSSVGVTEAEALKEGLEVESATVTVDDKHPAKLPNDSKQTLKLICMKRSGTVVGAQIVGNVDVGEMINILGLAIENQINIYSLINIQVATHPLLTSAPTAYPIAKVAQMLDLKINKSR